MHANCKQEAMHNLLHILAGWNWFGLGCSCVKDRHIGIVSVRSAVEQMFFARQLDKASWMR